MAEIVPIRGGKRYDPPKVDGEPLFVLGRPDWAGEWRVRIMDTPTAKRFLTAYHYLGSTHAMWSLGIFCPDLIAVVSIGQPANRNGVASKFGLQRWRGNYEITRVCVHPDAPKNTASRAIAAACHEYARTGFDWLFSYSDTGQGHHGGIYQAVNAVYVGLSPARAAWVLDGEPTHIRTLANRYGADGQQLVALLRDRGLVLERIAAGSSAKHTYILPIGTPATRRAIREHLEAYRRPYPPSAERLGAAA